MLINQLCLSGGNLVVHLRWSTANGLADTHTRPMAQALVNIPQYWEAEFSKIRGPPGEIDQTQEDPRGESRGEVGRGAIPHSLLPPPWRETG